MEHFEGVDENKKWLKWNKRRYSITSDEGSDNSLSSKKIDETNIKLHFQQFVYSYTQTHVYEVWYVVCISFATVTLCIFLVLRFFLYDVFVCFLYLNGVVRLTMTMTTTPVNLCMTYGLKEAHLEMGYVSNMSELVYIWVFAAFYLFQPTTEWVIKFVRVISSNYALAIQQNVTCVYFSIFTSFSTKKFFSSFRALFSVNRQAPDEKKK